MLHWLSFCQILFLTADQKGVILFHIVYESMDLLGASHPPLFFFYPKVESIFPMN